MTRLSLLAAVLSVFSLVGVVCGGAGAEPLEQGLGRGETAAKAGAVEPYSFGVPAFSTGSPRESVRPAVAGLTAPSPLALYRGPTGQSKAASLRRELYQGRPLRWWAHRAVVNRREANAGHRTIRRLRAGLRARHHGVEYALTLAATVYGVPRWQLRAVASCESHLYEFATNGVYRGLFQTGPMFERGPFGRAGFSVWDPVANALTAAYTVSREGWRQWSCRP